jgi:hypothetical protein
MISRLVVLGVCAALAQLVAGCGNLHVMRHVPLSSMSRLSSLTVADIDPMLLQVATRLPTALEPAPGGATMQISRGQGAPLNETFVLDAVTSTDETAALSAHARPGAQLWVFRLASGDMDRFRRVLAATTRDGAVQPGVTQSASVNACHRRPLAGLPLPTTTLLRTNASGYFVLLDDLDLRSVLKGSDITTRIAACR